MSSIPVDGAAARILELAEKAQPLLDALAAEIVRLPQLQDVPLLAPGEIAPSGPARPVAVPLFERHQRLREEANTAARAAAISLDVDHGVVNRRLNEAVGVSSIAQATEAQLQHRIRVARQWMQTGRPATQR